MAAYGEEDYRRPEPQASKSDLSLCATLLSLFDFGACGEVSRTDWERGLSTLLLGGLSSDDNLWQRLLQMYDPGGKGAVQLERVRDILPIDPRISVLLQQLVHSVAGCREYVARATARTAREVEMKSRRAVIRLRKSLLAPIFNGWLEVVRTERALKTRALRHMRHAGIGRAWHTWVAVTSNAELVSRKRQRMAKLARRIHERSVSMALNTWIDTHVQRRRLMRRARKVMGNGPLARAWSQWAPLASEWRRLRKVMGRGLQRGLARGFNAWCEVAEAMRRLKRIGSKALGGPLARGFNTWLDSLGDRKKMARFLRRALNRGMMRAFSRWLEKLDERDTLARFGKRALNRSVSAAWRTWLGLVEGRGRHREIGEKLLKSQILRPWNTWLALTDQRARMQSILRRGAQGGVLRAFNKWLAVNSQAAWLRERAGGVVSGGVGRAWRAWEYFLSERERKGRLVKKALSGTLLRSWNQWVGLAEQAAHLRSLAGKMVVSSLALGRMWLTWLEYNAAQGRLAKVARRMLSSSLARGFNTWLDSLGDRKKMARFLRRALNRGLARAFSRWLEMLDELATLARFAKRALNRSALKAWAAWVEMIEERERVLLLCKRCLQSGVMRAWNQWSDTVHGFKRMRRFGARFALHSVARAFESWVEMGLEAKRRARFFKRWQSAGVGRAFETWCEMCEQHHRVEKLARKVVRRMRGEVCERVFDAWTDFVAAEVERRRELRRRAINRLRDRLLALTFESWSTVVGAEERRREIMRPFANMLANRLLTLVFTAWRDCAAAASALRVRYAAKFAKTLLSKTFSAWFELAAKANEDERERRRIALDALMRMRQKQVVWVYRAWAEYVAEARASMARALARWEQSGVAAALDTWRSYVTARRRFTELATKMVARCRNRLLAKVYLAWAAHAAGEREERDKSSRRALALMSGKAELLLQVYFQAWAEEVRRTVERRFELATKMAARYANANLAKCYLAWAALSAAAAAERQQQYEKAAAFLSGRAELMLRLYFDSFCAAVAAAREDREALVRQALTRMRHGALCVAFEQWRDEVAAAVAARADASRHAEEEARRKAEAEAEAEAAAERARLEERARAAGMAPDGLQMFTETASTLLRTTESLSAAVAELKDAEASRDLAAEVTVEDSNRTAEATHARLVAIERQLAKTTTMLERSERLLAPLPSAAIDQAAYAMMKSEVSKLGDELVTTQRQMGAMQAAKVGRYELNNMRSALHSFLFGTESAPTPPAPLPLPLQAPPSLAMQSTSGSTLPPAPRPPTSQRRDRLATRPVFTRPATARTNDPYGPAASGAGGAEASAFDRRPASARDGTVAYPDSVAAANGGAEFVEVTDLTQLYEERGASARRTAGGRGSVTAARPRPPSGIGAARPGSPRTTGAASPRTSRFPLM